MSTRIFVYGTLKRGGGNWRYHLKGKAKFITEAQIHGTMYHLGGFPAISLHGDGNIHGEIFEVDDDTLASCDRLEGHPRWYVRTPVQTSRGPAEVYVMNQLDGSDTRTIKDGIWPVNYTEDDEIEEMTENF